MIELEKAVEAQAREKSYITDLMGRWRCQSMKCPQFGKGACLVLPGDPTCRLLNAQLLSQWEYHIKKGTASVEGFPINALKLPPLKGAGKPNLPPALPSMQPQYAPPFPATPQPIYIPYPHHSTPTTYRQATRYSSPIRGSSPIRPGPEEDPDALLDSYFIWYVESNTCTGDRKIKTEAAAVALKDAFEDLEGIRKMKEDGWKELNVPVGIGKGLSRDVKRFLSQRRH